MPHEKLYFATHNAHKVDEVRAVLCDAVDLAGLDALDCHDEIPETGRTLQENALQKAQFVHTRYGVDCFADDTGLEVEALGGEPGIYSARYAGEPSDPAKNRQKLLEKMQGAANRKARFRTVIALLSGGETHFFEGIVTGRIVEAERGESGFGYDRLFAPDGSDRTFAEMTAAEKNAISHRGRAMRQLNEFLSNRHQNENQ